MLSLFISRKIYANGDNRNKVSRPAIKIATLGVAIGLVVMLLSVSVVLGFKHTIRDKIVGFSNHITVGNFMSFQTGADSSPIQMDDSVMTVLKAVPGVEHVQRFATCQGILKTDDDFLGVALKGVAQEWDSTFIHDNLIEGTIPQFSDSVSSNMILVSKSIADKLRLKCGERVFAYFIDNDGVRSRRFTISGIYETNLSQFDETLCFTDLRTAVKLNGWESDQTDGAELKLTDFDQIATVENSVVEAIHKTEDHYGETFSSRTIQELNPQIFSWLDLLDMNVWIILLLMILVSSVTMISGLLIIILERTSMIGVMKALGARNSLIRHTFLWFGSFIIGRGLLIGNLIAAVLFILQNTIGIVHLDPQTYYVSTVPVEFNLLLWILINIATLLVSVLVLVVPSMLVAHISPSKAIKYD